MSTFQSLLVGLISLFVGGQAFASAPAADPEFTLAFRGTTDFWANAVGGLSRGSTTLNKDQLSATWTANRLGDPGFRIHAQMFHTNGERLTSRTGDLQTASNIEALSTNRLFEAWVEQTFGKPGDGAVSVRAGLIDLNSDFDSIDPASLFINSSHGIAPDLSKSGRNGPSIFPVTSMALRLTWTPSDQWTVRGGVFDGVPGDLSHPREFAAASLSASDGALAIAEVDRKFGKDAQVSVGTWIYSASLPVLGSGGSQRDGGVFGFVEGGAPGFDGVKGWLRVGLGNPDVQVVSGYLGAGLVKTEPLPGRKDDRLGVAIANAFVSPAARRAMGLRRAETSIETSYQFKMVETVALQPDVQYVIHPSSRAGIPNALVFGLRVVLTAGYPNRSKATDFADPTVPPDAPKPEEPGNGSNAPNDAQPKSPAADS